MGRLLGSSSLLRVQATAVRTTLALTESSLQPVLVEGFSYTVQFEHRSDVHLQR